MPAAALSENEILRLQALRNLEVLDTEVEDEFNALVKAAALVCNVPISLVSLVDETRQWFKANIGLPNATQTPREYAFCGHAILQDELFEVKDALQDQRFADNPLVLQDPSIRFYAGFPLKLSGGEKVGTLCVIDTQPHELTELQRNILEQLSIVTVKALESRRARLKEKSFYIAEQSLLKAADYTASIFKNVLEPIIAVMLDGTVTHWNAGAEKLFGYANIEMIGKDIACLIPHERRYEEGDFDGEFKKHPNGRVYQTQYLHKDGMLIDVSVSLNPLLNSEGVLIGATKIVHDIREQVRMNTLLAENEARFKRLYQSTPAMLQSIDPDGYLMNVSDLWLEKHGYTRDEVIGRHSADFMTPASAQYSKNVVIPQAMKQGSCQNVIYQKVKKSGEVFDVSLSSLIDYDKNGNPVRGIAVLTDITEEKAARRAADELLSTINNQFITVIADPQGYAIEVNDAYCALNQLNKAEIINQQHQVFTSDCHPQELFDQILSVLREGQTWKGQISYRAKDGSLYWLDSVYSPLMNNNGKIERFIVISIDITKRKRTEQLALEQQKQIQQILENQSVAMFMIDTDHQVTHWNHACEIVTGALATDMIGKEAWRGFYKTVRPCLADLVLSQEVEKAGIYYPVNKQASLIEAGWHAENWFDDLGGKRRYLMFDAAPIYDSNGNITGVIETLQDVTESKINEQKLAEERQFLSSVIEGTNAGTWQWNVQTGVCQFNARWANMLGYELSELGANIDDTWKRLVHPEDLSICMAQLNRHFSGESAMYEATFRMLHKADKWVWVFARGRVLTFTEDQRPEWMFGTHIDITHSVESDQARKHLDRLYHLMSENVQGYATFVLDPEGIVTTWNQGAQALKGYEAHEIIGKSFEHFYTEEEIHNGTPMKLLNEARYRGHAQNECWKVRKDGSEFYADVTLKRIDDEDGTVLGYVKVTRDATARKKMDNELKQAYENLEEFTSIASHDLKSPLQGIANLVEWVKEDIGEDVDENIKNNLDRIDVRVKRMEGLINDLLHYSRASKVDVKQALVDPETLIEEIVELQNIPNTFNVTVSAEVAPFTTEITPLTTILRNLISNAVKHHDKPKGKIQVKVRKQKQFYVFSITDDGPGIPEISQGRVFKLFQTLSKSQSSTGLGLALSKRMADTHGGKIELLSNANQRGTTFKVFWPIVSVVV